MRELGEDPWMRSMRSRSTGERPLPALGGPARQLLPWRQPGHLGQKRPATHRLTVPVKTACGECHLLHGSVPFTSSSLRAAWYKIAQYLIRDSLGY